VWDTPLDASVVSVMKPWRWRSRCRRGPRRIRRTSTVGPSTAMTMSGVSCTCGDAACRSRSGDVCPAHEGFEALVGGVLVPPDDVAADHAALGLVGGVV